MALPEVLSIDDVPEPRPGPGEVLVAVRATSVNPVDCKLRAGYLRVVVRWTLPHTTGLDVSGVVEAVGAGVTDWEPGDEVVASPSHRRDGTAAERCVVGAGELARKPPNLVHEDAASLPLVGLTAWDSLVTFAGLAQGERLLVLNGTGGVGSIAVQLGHALGAEVTATCSPRNFERVRALGATTVIDYRDDPLRSLPAQDVVLVAVGDGAPRVGLAAARRGGRVANIVGDMPRWVERHGPWLGTARAGLEMTRWSARARLMGRRARNVVRASDGRRLADLMELVADGRVMPVVEARYPLAEIASAHAHVERGRTFGKVVVTVS